MDETIVADQPSRSNCRRRGCIGCLALFGLSICLGALLIFAGPALLRAVGVGPPSTEDFYGGAPDPVASQAVEEILSSAGVSGSRAWVIPIKGGDGNVALITLDDSANVFGAGSEAANQQAFEQVIRDLAAADEAGMNLSHVVVDVRGENGETLVSMGASQDDINAFAAGQLAQNQFLYQVEVDFSRLISADMLQQLMEESQQ